MKKFFKSVQYAQPYALSNIPVQRLDEEYIENPFGQQNTNANISQNNDQQIFEAKIARRKHTLIISAALIVFFVLLVSIAYFTFLSRKSAEKELEPNSTDVTFSAIFHTEIDLKNTIIQNPQEKRYIMRGNDECTKSHRDLSVKCGLDINTCSINNLKEAMSILMDRGFETTFNEKKKYFNWYKNLNFFVITDVADFQLVNESTINTAITFFFSYKNEAPVIVGLSKVLNETLVPSQTISKDEFMQSFEFLLSPCHWYEVKVLDVTYK